MSKKKQLAMAVLAAVASVGFVVSASAEETMTHEVDPVIVIGRTDLQAGGFVNTSTEVGILGNKEIIDTPFTKVHLSEKAINSFDVPGEGISSALMNVASVRSASTTMYNDVNIRGTRVNGYQFYVNGVPGLFTQTNLPTNYIEGMEVTSGPAMGFTGTTTQETAGGLVNILSKRAGREDVTNAKLTFSGKGSFGQYVDVGRRFGKNQEWGLRVNAQNLSGETAISDEKLTSRNLFINVDHQSTKSSSNLLLGYRYVKHENGVRWFTYGTGVTKLPKAPDAKTQFSFPGQIMEYDTWLGTLNHEQKLSKDWTAFFTGGFSRYVLGTNYNAASSAYQIVDNSGKFQAKSWSKTFPVSSYYAQVGVKGKVQTGIVTNNIAFALDKAWYNNGSGIAGQNFNMGVYGNLYDNSHMVWDTLADKLYTGKYTAKNQYWGLSAVDTLEIGKVDVTLGFHRHGASVTSYNAVTGVQSGATQSSDATSPTYAICYRPDKNFAFYANHAESFNKGAVAPQNTGGHTMENGGAMIDPTKTKQNEIGIKYQNDNLLTSLALFETKAKAGMAVERTPGKWWYQNDGESTYKGVELNVSGKIAPKWNLLGGIMYLNAEISKSSSVADGTRVNSVPRWSGVVGLEYNADENFTVLGRYIYTGSCPIMNEKLTVPSWNTIDLGVKYKTKLSNTPVTVSAMCYNVAGKDYWISSNGNTMLSNPRSFLLSAEFSL